MQTWWAGSLLAQNLVLSYLLLDTHLKKSSDINYLWSLHQQFLLAIKCKSSLIDVGSKDMSTAPSCTANLIKLEVILFFSQRATLNFLSSGICLNGKIPCKLACPLCVRHDTECQNFGRGSWIDDVPSRAVGITCYI